MTAEGTIVGTFHYMAPEQLEGREADARSDIFSFGAVMHEMATGQRAFDGKATASVIAAVLERDPPPISSIQPMSPPALDRTVKICLAKNPDERFQSAFDLKLQLEWIREGGSQAGVPAPVVAHRRNRERLGWAAGGLVTLIAALLAWGLMAHQSQPPQAVVAQIPPPENAEFAFWGISPGMPALSPDGTQLAFAAETNDGKQMLWVRPLNSPAARPLQGTEGAAYPFWSPEGRSIGYFVMGKLNRIGSAGGPPITIADLGQTAAGGTWSPDGTILIGTALSGILRLPASGGAPVQVIKTNSRQVPNGWPQLLPDHKHFLFFEHSSLTDPPARANSGTYAASLDGGEPKLVLPGPTEALYAPPGYLLFVRDETLMAQPFDAGDLHLSGEPLPIADHVRVNGIVGRPIVSLSANGTIVFQNATQTEDQILWYDLSGKILSQTGTSGDFGSPSISPDGKRVAISWTDSSLGKPDLPDIWVYDLARGIKTRLTFGQGVNAGAFWSPDGKVCFVSNRSGRFRLYEELADGTGTATPLVDNEDHAEFFGTFSADGRYLAFQRSSDQGFQRNASEGSGANGPANGEIWAAALTGDRKPFPVVQNGQFVAIEPALSPDGKWLSYVSDESGDMEVYVVPFPHGSGKWQISSGRGTWPHWSPDGKKLYYRSGHTLMSVEISHAGADLGIGKIQEVFQANPAPGGLGSMYDIAADGRRVVVVVQSGQIAEPLTVVTNWPALLKKP